MTSKNLFLTSIIENMKRRSWLFALSSLFFFFYFPVVTLVFIQNLLSYVEYDRISVIENVQEFLMEITSFGPLSLFIVTIAAFIFAMQGYSYLHNRKKVDFYHCLPVSKPKRFSIIYINGFLAFFFPYLFALCFTLGIAAMTPGFLTSALVSNAFYGFLLNQLCFLAIYNIVIIAVMLTGHGMITFLGVCVFMFYEFLIKFLITMFSSEYFRTFSTIRNFFENNVTSPLFYCATKMVSMEYYDLTSFAANHRVMTQMLPMLLLYILLYGAIAYLLYAKRPSEASGKAMAFAVTKPIIKIMLVVPISLFSAILFRSMTNNSLLFTIFGLLIGLLLCHGLLEVIYEFDLRAAFHHGKQLFLSLGIALLIYFIFRFDFFGYDTRIPNKSNLESASVLLYTGESYYTIQDNYYTYLSWNEYQDEHMKLTDLSLIQELVESSVEYSQTDYPTYDESLTLNVKFQLKNGREKYRRYTFDTTKNSSLVDRLFVMEEFKTGIHQIYDDTLFAPDKMHTFNTFYTNGYENAPMTAQQSSALLELYKRELMRSTYTEQSSEGMVGQLNFERKVKDNLLVWSYPIYSSFTETIQYLKEQKLYVAPHLDAETIHSIEVTYDDYDVISDTNQLVSETKQWVSKTNVYTDTQEIEEIVNVIYPSQFSYVSQYGPQLSNSYSIAIYFKENASPDYANSYNERICYFLEDSVPEFVIRDATSEQ